METSSSNFSLWSVVCSQLPLPIRQVAKNQIVTNKIWSQFRKQSGLHASSGLAPISRNHLFLPSCSDLVFQTWLNKGLLTMYDLCDKDVFYSFADLSAKFNLPKTHLFQFLQIRHFVQNKFPQFPNRPPGSMIDSFLTLNTRLKRLTSTIYDQIFKLNSTSLDSLRATWEQDLGITMSDEQWGLILDLVHTSSICARHSLLQCKILHRHFISPTQD